MQSEFKVVSDPLVGTLAKNIFAEGELDENMVVAFFATTTQHGSIEGKTQTHKVAFYNLEMNISRYPFQRESLLS